MLFMAVVIVELIIGGLNDGEQQGDRSAAQMVVSDVPEGQLDTQWTSGSQPVPDRVEGLADAPRNNYLTADGWLALPGEVEASVGSSPGRRVQVGVVGAAAQDWTALVSQYEWPVFHAIRIIRCESDGRSWAVSPDGQNWGAMQINLVHLDKLEALTGTRDPQVLLVPTINIAVGYAVYIAAGRTWSPWACDYPERPDGR